MSVRDRCDWIRLVAVDRARDWASARDGLLDQVLLVKLCVRGLEVEVFLWHLDCLLCAFASSTTCTSLSTPPTSAASCLTFLHSHLVDLLCEVVHCSCTVRCAKFRHSSCDCGCRSFCGIRGIRSGLRSRSRSWCRRLLCRGCRLRLLLRYGWASGWQRNCNSVVWLLGWLRGRWLLRLGRSRWSCCGSCRRLRVDRRWRSRSLAVASRSAGHFDRVLF